MQTFLYSMKLFIRKKNAELHEKHGNIRYSFKNLILFHASLAEDLSSFYSSVQFQMLKNFWSFEESGYFFADFWSSSIFSFDIFASHGRWNEPVLNSLIPGAFSVTILRKPVESFESLFSYTGLSKNLKMNINQFAEAILNNKKVKYL